VFWRQWIQVREFFVFVMALFLALHHHDTAITRIAGQFKKRKKNK
jgi:hypothetical protein